ncbi:MAG: hypothetical protein QME14_07405 [Methanobacteriaceae archaeon]|nr:hypothetical protein [Methanobacteriaceae archaeon]
MNLKELSADIKSIILGSIVSIILIGVNITLLSWFIGPVIGSYTYSYLKRDLNIKKSLIIGFIIGLVFVVFSILFSLILSGGKPSIPSWNNMLLIIGGLTLRVILASLYGLIGGLIAYISLKIFYKNK